MNFSFQSRKCADYALIMRSIIPIMMILLFLLPQLAAQTPVESIEEDKTTEENTYPQVIVEDDDYNRSEKDDEGGDEDYRLKNPELMEKFVPAKEKNFATGEHVFFNILLGGLAGGAVGATGSLAFYNSDEGGSNENNLGLYAGTFAGIGMLSGAIASYFEVERGEQFTIGYTAWNYTWYGLISGATAGAITGLIPYSSSDNTDDIYNYIGYGAFAGVAVSTALFFLNMPENITFYAYAPQSTGTRVNMALVMRY